MMPPVIPTFSLVATCHMPSEAISPNTPQYREERSLETRVTSIEETLDNEANDQFLWSSSPPI